MLRAPFPIAAAGLVALLAAAPLAAQQAGPLTADIAGPDGTPLGRVTALPTASGQMLLDLDLTGLPPGIHGVHVHETGDCGSADFASAGGHLHGDKQHGVMTEGGIHPGDLPNVSVPESGAVAVEYFVPALTPEALMDADGSAFVIHAQPDDYSSQPSGNAGDRIGCGVFAPSS
ncbi:MAG: superoxide dismutase family protein [Paracoccus sp. (in: a-proteobacteria)]